MDAQVTKRLGEKRGSDFRLWDSVTRAARGGLGPADGGRGMIDALHHAANVSHTRSLTAARDLLAVHSRSLTRLVAANCDQMASVND